MNKKCLIILKGYELMLEIASGKIKEGTKFKDLTVNNYADDRNIYRYENNNFIGRWGGTNILKLLNHDFEILEDEEEIDIQGIEEKDISYVICDSDFEEGCITKLLNRFFKENQKYIDEILKAVKQLDKKMKKEE